MARSPRQRAATSMRSYDQADHRQHRSSSASSALDGYFVNPDDRRRALTSDVARQLMRVARMIDARGIAGPCAARPSWSAQGGYDNHSGQIAMAAPTTAGAHANLLGDLAVALAGFHRAMQAIGMAENVTSVHDERLRPHLSRAMPESSADHAWGSNHLVVGGNVAPRRHLRRLSRSGARRRAPISSSEGPLHPHRRAGGIYRRDRPLARRQRCRTCLCLPQLVDVEHRRARPLRVVPRLNCVSGDLRLYVPCSGRFRARPYPRRRTVANLYRITPFMHVPDFDAAVWFLHRDAGLHAVCSALGIYAYVQREQPPRSACCENAGDDGAPPGEPPLLLLCRRGGRGSGRRRAEAQERRCSTMATSMDPMDQIYGQRELMVVAPDGNLLPVFGQDISISGDRRGDAPRP